MTRSNLVPDIPHALEDPWEQNNMSYYRDLHRRAISKRSWVGAGNFTGKKFQGWVAPPSLAASGHSRGNPWVPHRHPGMRLCAFVC